MKTSRLHALKVYSRGIRRLVDSGRIVKMRNGVYRLPERSPSEASLIAGMFPDGVVCMHSALFHYAYADRTPFGWDIAISKNVSKSRFHIDGLHVNPYYVDEGVLDFGVVMEDFDGQSLRVYDRDRLICECLRRQKSMDRETFNKAVLSYIADPKKNVASLIDYGKKRRISKRIKQIIGLWL